MLRTETQQQQQQPPLRDSEGEDEARDGSTSALAAPPTFAEQRARCHTGRSASLLSLAQPHLALGEAEMAVQLQPTSARSHGARCAAYFLLSQLAEAARDCSVALEHAAKEEDSDDSDDDAAGAAYQRQLQRLLSQIATARKHRPLEAVGALVAGENATLPWFLRAEALAALLVGAAPAAATTTTGGSEPATRGGSSRGVKIKEAVRQFILGGRGGGAPAHPHSHAVNSLAFGEKRWRMWAPEHTHFSATSPWFGWDGGAKEGMSEFLECTQRGGDIMYVPASWGHSVLTVRDSVGQTTEFELQLDGKEL